MRVVRNYFKKNYSEGYHIGGTLHGVGKGTQIGVLKKQALVITWAQKVLLDLLKNTIASVERKRTKKKEEAYQK